VLRGKTLVAGAGADALASGVGMVSTLMLKDTSDRTAFKVFEPGGTADLPGFGFANNLLLLADPASFRQLPWTPATGWVQAQPWFQDGTPVELDTRRILQRALERLRQAGFTMKCGLEVEFHIYRIDDPQLDPMQAAWPGPPPKVSLIHPGYNLLAESWYDMAEEPLRIVQHTAQALGLPLLSLEIELGPSQVEAVFDATDALTAADNMVLFRNAAKMALRRAGYHATFMCRPPFPNIMSSGWHLHQSLVDLRRGENLFMPGQPGALLSATGLSYVAGLLDHARSGAVFATPTVNGYRRFRPNSLAPDRATWGYDHRGVMLRVLGGVGDPATRVENRIGEPAANPYLYILSQVVAGLDGIERELQPPPTDDEPYAAQRTMLPTSLPDALDALDAEPLFRRELGDTFIDYFLALKRTEAGRYLRWVEQAGQPPGAEPTEWEQNEYFDFF
jgi:glutamine synthetase